jgi:hypothetical protein
MWQLRLEPVALVSDGEGGHNDIFADAKIIKKQGITLRPLKTPTANAYYFFHPLSFIAMFVYCHCMQAVGLQGMVAQGQVRSTATLGE